MNLNEQESKIVSHVDANSGTLSDWVRQLVSIPTVNPYSGDAGNTTEAEGQAWIASRFSEMGARVRKIPVPQDVYTKAGVNASQNRSWTDRENVVGEWDFGKDGPTVILNSHMDTVGITDMEISPFDPVLRDGRIYGRGASDSKGNLAMGLTAVGALLENGAGLHGRIIFTSVVDEECGGAGAGTLACCQAGITGDLAIVLDGSRGVIASGCNGGTTAYLKVYGQSGHSSSGNSVSAIDKGFAVKQAVDAFAADYAGRHPSCRGSVRIFRAGHLPSIVPSCAELWINLTYDLEEAQKNERSSGRWDGTLFQQRLETRIRQLADTDPWFREKPVEIKWSYDLVPYAIDSNGALPVLALQACHDTGDLPAVVGQMPAWFDAANISRQLRIPVIGMGHGSPGAAHSANEWVDLAGLSAGAKSLAVTLSRLLRPGGASIT